MQTPDNSQFDFQPDDFEMVSYRDGKGNLITKEEYERLQAAEAAPVVDGTITDVAFAEIKKEAPLFNPAVFLTEALINADLIDAAAKWSIGIDPRAETADNEKDRIFFANRALRLFLAEVEDRENITPRMLLADGIDSVKWIALMEQGVIPWLLNQFDKKGKRIVPEAEAEAAQVERNETGSAESLPESSTGIFDKPGEFVEQPAVWQGNDASAPVVIGVDFAEGSDQTAHMPVKWNVPIHTGNVTETEQTNQEEGHFLQESAPSDDSSEER